MTRRIAVLVPVATVGALVAALTACSSSGGSPSDTGSTDAGSTTPPPKDVVIATHDSWAAPDDLIKAFETRSGFKVTILKNGDAGTLTNKLVLTKDSPIADAVYGIDNTFASRAVDEGVLADYRSPGVAATPGGSSSPASTYDVPGDEKQLTPIDWGDVCVNVDDAWFAKKKLAAPKSLDDLIAPAYKNLFVTPGAASSSPGFAFLLATIAKYGVGWKDYWTKLMHNGAKLDSGWSDAWSVDYTAGGGNGDRPIVLSYNTSPVDTIPEGGDKPTTSALLDTCFRQVEYAGVLSHANNPVGAKAFIDFLSGKAFQESMPDNMYVFPVNPDAALPDAWAKWAPPASKPWSVPPADIAKNRQAWLTEWSDITS